MKPILKLLRPAHWLKNALVLVPLVFSGRLLDAASLTAGLLATLAFCLVASLVYVVNDLMDADADRAHPTKCERPIASGAVSQVVAVAIALCLAALAVAADLLSGAGLTGLALLGGYVAMNLAYSAGLKRLPVLDVTILALGFLLRVVYGALACGVEVSGWLYLTVLAGSFYLGLGKRRGEMDAVGEGSRAVLRGYTRAFLDKNMYVFLGLAIAFYALWARESGARLWTVPLVMVIFMRYSLVVEAGGDGDPMGVVLHDKVLMALVGAYAILVLAIIYLPGVVR